MKVLHTSDLHCVARLSWVARAARGFDLVCITGDLIDAGSPGSIQSQIAEISAIIASIETPIALCSGNHDFDVLEARWLRSLKRRGVWLDGDRFEIGGRRFYCHGWNEPVVTPRHPGEIWITHAPPAGTTTALEHGCLDMGDHEFGVICRSEWGPRLVLCGHVHNPRSWFAQSGRTLVLNPGQRAGSEPTCIVLDLEARTAVRHVPEETPKLVKLPGPDAREVMAGKTRFYIEAQLRAAVSNMEIEGYRFTPEEIDEIRRRLWRLADAK